MATIALTVSYNGEVFSGYAKQPGQLTVQGEIENALETIFSHPVATTCAGRTDAGVHARGQIVSFDIPDEEYQGRNPESIMRSLNALTHERISIRGLSLRFDGFSARFDAVQREYRYFIATGNTPPIFMNDYCWYVDDDLDIGAMYDASRCLIGEHDFKSFCVAASSHDKTTMRNVSDISFSYENVMGESLLVVKVCGNAFLHSMVRAIVGSLVMVGRGKREVGWIKTALEACDRTAAGETAPAKGLVLWNVTYLGDENLYGASEEEPFTAPAENTEEEGDNLSDADEVNSDAEDTIDEPYAIPEFARNSRFFRDPTYRVNKEYREE